MSRALYTAATGMIAQQMNVDNIANNLANVNTTGYKKSKMEFQDLLYQQLRMAGATQAEGAQVPVELQIGYGTRPVATQRIFTQGTVIATNNPLDVSIDGDGFLQVSLPDGTVSFTRDGALKKSSEGIIVTSDGYPVEPQVTVPQDASAINISSNGEVSVLIPGDPTQQQVGQLELARFVNPAGLKSIGRNLFLESEASGAAVTGAPDSEGFGKLSQGFLELSNVEVVDEMVGMIVAQRAYEINAKAIQTSEEMLANANSLKR
jgi:flagellar basal-body rod protein FlgG